MEPDINSKRSQSTDRKDESFSKTVSSSYYPQSNSLNDEDYYIIGSNRASASSSTTLEGDFISSPSSSSSSNLSENDIRNQNKTPKGTSLSGNPTVTPSSKDSVKNKGSTYPSSTKDGYNSTSHPSITELVEEFSTDKFNDLDDISSITSRNAKAKISLTRSINKLPAEHHDKTGLLIKRAKILLYQKKYEECMSDCAQAIKLAYKNINDKPSTTSIRITASTNKEELIRALLCKAQAQKALEKYEAAIVTYEEVIFLNCSFNASMMVEINQCKQYLFNDQGDYMFETGRFKDSEVCFTMAINVSTTKSNDLVLLWNKRSAAFMEQGQYINSLKDCESSIELAIDNVESKTKITLLVKNSGTTIEKMLSEALFRKAQALEALDRHQEAIQAFGKAKSFDHTKDSHATEGIGRCRQVMFKDQGSTSFKKGLFKEAERAYTNAINDLPSNHGDLVLLLNNRAAAFLKQSKYEQSLRDCESAIKIARGMVANRAPQTFLLKKSATTVNVQLVKALLRKAKSLELLNRPESAIQIYNNMQDDDAKNSQAKDGRARCNRSLYKNEGDLFFKQTEYGSAVESYTRAIEAANPRDGDAVVLLNNRATAFIEQGKFGRGFRDCVAAIDLANYCIQIEAPVTPIRERMATTVHTQLVKALSRKAQALKGLKRYEDAIQAYEESMRLDAVNCTQMMKGIRECRQVLHKEEGDKLMKKGEFSKAETSYTSAIMISSSENEDLIILWSSRAKVFMKQFKYENCLKDCSSAIESAYRKLNEETPSKIITKQLLIQALSYKALALEKLTRYEAAIVVYEDIVAEDYSYRKEMQENVERCRALQNKKMKDEAEANMSDTVKEMREREKKKKAEEAEKLAKEEVVNEKIYLWKNGKQGDLRALLCSLESILWPEVLVKEMKIDVSSSATECKKLYKQVITKIHPDKLPKATSVEQRLIATRVFQILDENWKRFKSTQGL